MMLLVCTHCCLLERWDDRPFPLNTIWNTFALIFGWNFWLWLIHFFSCCTNINKHICIDIWLWMRYFCPDTFTVFPPVNCLNVLGAKHMDNHFLPHHLNRLFLTVILWTFIWVTSLTRGPYFLCRSTRARWYCSFPCLPGSRYWKFILSTSSPSQHWW